MDASEQDQARARAHLDSLYLFFEDDKRGQAIYEDLHRQFVKAPNPRDFSQEGMLRTFVQTHQREVLEYIVRCQNRARGVQDDPPTEGHNDELS